MSHDSEKLERRNRSLGFAATFCVSFAIAFSCLVLLWESIDTEFALTADVVTFSASYLACHAAILLMSTAIGAGVGTIFDRSGQHVSLLTFLLVLQLIYRLFEALCDVSKTAATRSKSVHDDI